MRHERRLAGAGEARQNGDGQRALARRVHRLGRGLNYPLLPIHEAARYWDVDQIQELISKGVNPDALDEPGGRTPLFFACCEESNFTAALSNDEGHADAQVACAKVLLRAGASAKAANVYGLGPIHCAAACRRAGARLVELLIIYGADPNQSTGGGRTPLHAAAQHGHAATVHALLRAGADANFRGRYGTALDLANCPHPTGASRHRRDSRLTTQSHAGPRSRPARTARAAAASSPTY